MTSLAQRLLFFGAGLAFGVLVGWLAGRSAPGVGVTPGAPLVSGAPAAPIAPPPPVAEPPAPVDEERLEALLAGVETRPEDPAARAAVGHLYLEARDFSEAAYWFRQARNLAPADLASRAALGLALLGMGDVQGAAAEYEAVLAEDPAHGGALLALGRLRLYALQDMAGGIELWERFLAAHPDAPEAGELREAVRALRSAHPE